MYIKTPPIIELSAMSFSFIIVHHKKNSSHGIEEYDTKEKIITPDKRIALPYYSERDISGNFKLNYENVNEQKNHMQY